MSALFNNRTAVANSSHSTLLSNTPPDQRTFTGPPPAMLRTPSNPLTNGSRAQNRMSGEYRNRAPAGMNGNGSVPVPAAPPSQFANGHSRNVTGPVAMPSFDMARSPPNAANKNTKHVPCKFFRQGACQAGQACPFLHSTDATVDAAPCKYFTKGNCKFGAKCALAHILPDGRRVNRPNMGMGIGGHLNLGGRVNPPTFHNQDSALANSLMSQQQIHGPNVDYPYMGSEELGQQRNPYDNIPMIDTGFASPASKYGSPGDDSRRAMSPVGHHLTALDAPLPASFDSQGISYIARHGPVAASVPSKFAMESPPASLPHRTGGPSDVVRGLHATAFGAKIPSHLGSSPPAVPEETIGQRVMHSSRVSRPKLLSASLPRPNVTDEWDDSFALEEDYLPHNLHDEVLTPQEKMRRMSRTDQEFGSARETPSGFGIPAGSSSKVGSPLGSSPSRFSALFAKQKAKKEEENLAAFGHVGSPLRESLINPDASSRWGSGDLSPSMSSPARQSSLSMISQQLQRTHIKRTESSESGNSTLHPSSARHSSAPTGRFDRSVSSPGGINSNRIDEEAGELVFSMEEDENSKRSSMISVPSKSPNLAPLKDSTNMGGEADAKPGKSFLTDIDNSYFTRT